MGSVANLSSTPYGRRLLPTLIDEVSSQDPNRECFQIPRSSEPSDGWRVLTWKDMANAVNRCAHRIVEVCGTPEKDTFPTIAYLGPNDVRYIVLMIAAVKAGYAVSIIVIYSGGLLGADLQTRPFSSHRGTPRRASSTSSTRRTARS